MNREPPHFADDDEEPLVSPPKPARRKTSRAETFGWCASLFGFASVASVLLLSFVAVGTRAALSGACLLLCAAFFALAWRELQ